MRFLRKGLDVVDTWLRDCMQREGSSESKGSILAAKSALIRNLAMQDLGPSRRTRLAESIRCIELAYNLSKHPAVSLEYGLNLWARARVASSDAEYKELLQQAEGHLVSAATRRLSAARLAPPRFYRLTYRPMQCLENWPTDFPDFRAVLRNSYIYGEAAIDITYGKYPPETVTECLSNAIALLEQAISAGYRTARIITALAFTRGLSDGSIAASTALNEIASSHSGLDYQAVFNLITRQPNHGIPDDLPTEQLALGITDGRALAALGTFAVRILNDNTLGEALYRTALTMDPTNAVAYTNLARLLFRRSPDRIDEVRRLLQKAQTYADRRFTWWRNVLEEVQRPNSSSSPVIAGVVEIPDSIDYQNLTQLKKRFKRVEQVADPNARGRLFERLVAAMARLTLGVASGPYKQPRSGYSHEIDGYLEHRGRPYIYECRWRSGRANKTDIEVFASKVRTVSTRGGIFFSMAGFDDGAVAMAKEVLAYAPMLLVDGDEIRDLFNLRIALDELIEFKRQYVDRVGEPFKKLKSSSLEVA
jgi:hypothetical protein